MDKVTNPASYAAKADMINQARSWHRKAQWRWDFISAENSMGWHSPKEALRILGEGIDMARQAQLKANLAVGTAVGGINNGLKITDTQPDITIITS